MEPLAPDGPRERQRFRLPESRLRSLREWALEGTGITAAARARDPDGRIALAKNGWSDGWLPPGGAVETGETPLEAARGEVREETGLGAVVGEPLVVVEQTDVSERDGAERFSALYLVYSATAAGEIPDASRLGVSDEEVRAAQWFETPPESLHDGDPLQPYLRPA